ncbi:GntR family transcriptional regulator [Microvirga terrae]|uniref:GntR family transcriptional regulator n=1 Tax=Microvirga terrae TaxID=2740529 RepID=A0ABY5RKQ3_9HYPH|nr:MULTISPECIES: GntR family transcriptional regulator [Microvirga]MBQ0821726.1 GntR family transcriptional regulator [Microvirga sp. HBU67558]UVF17801.1 GntR family transcriptional regulator [Microvirga terrae]
MDGGERQASTDRVRLVANALEEDIVLGWLQPRERLIEEDIAARFDVKRHVVREAIAELERMGLVERVQNKGATVRMMSPTDVRQIYFVREALETLAAREIPLPPRPETIARLIEIHGQHSAAVENGDARAAFRANMAFHTALFEACGNPHLIEAIRTLAQKAHGVRSYTAANPMLLARARDDHQAMIEALEASDRERLIQLCQDHLRPAREAYIASVEQRFGKAG